MISEERLKHSLGVARECAEIARSRNMCEDFVDACFLMGFLHDVGYEKCSEDTHNHPEKSMEMIDNFIKFRLNCMNAILNHGNLDAKGTICDYILNKADMTVNHLGEKVTMEERLSDIEKYHSDRPDVIADCKRMVEHLTAIEEAGLEHNC